MKAHSAYKAIFFLHLKTYQSGRGFQYMQVSDNDKDSVRNGVFKGNVECL